MNILVSVITAVYNDEEFIEKSVDSILNQTLSEFEFIIVDDGSTDNTLKILNELSKKDKRVKVISQKNSGAASARNTAIDAAKGFYIAIQDSDDISSPDRLKKQVDQLLNSGDDNLISCTGYNIIDIDDAVVATHNKIYNDITGNVLKGNTSVCHPSMMLAKNLLISVGGYNTFYSKTEDYDLIYRLLEGGAFVDKINECLYSYRMRENSESSMNNGAYWKRVYENHLNRISNRPENFDIVLNEYKKNKNVLVKRYAMQIFYSEDYPKFRKFYLRYFYKLPISNSVFFIYSLLPQKIKGVIKTTIVNN